MILRQRKYRELCGVQVEVLDVAGNRSESISPPLTASYDSEDGKWAVC